METMASAALAAKTQDNLSSFEPAVAATSGVSLRKKCIDAGLTDEAEIRRALATAAFVIDCVPSIRLERFNPLTPMAGIYEG